MNSNFWIAFLFTFIAGISTVLGAVISVFVKRDSKKFLAVALGFSAGVMIYVSMVEIFFKAQESLVSELGDLNGVIVNVCAFFGGIIIIAVIDKLIPNDKNLHEVQSFRIAGDVDENLDEQNKKKHLKRMGLFTALAVGIHNFPEGLATFVSALNSPTLAIPIVIAISIHNIPEGIAIAAPIYQSTGSRKKAFFWSTMSGIAEPIGALIGYFLLMPILNEITMGVIFAIVAGIMVFISIDELLPASREYADHHYSIYGFIGGMAVMAVSLILLQLN